MRTRLFAVMALGTLMVGRALAQPPTPSDDSALKGPTVTDRPAPKGKPTGVFGPDAIEKKKISNKSAPPPSMPEFLRALDVLHRSPTPEAARPSAAQDAGIKSAAAEFDAAMKSYMEKNTAELDSLRAKLSPNDRNMLDQQLARGGPIRLSKAGFGGKKSVLKNKDRNKGAADATPAPSDPTRPARQPSASDDAAKTRARIVEIYAGRPKVEDTQAKILGMLTPDQLSLAQAELAKLNAPRGSAHPPKGAGRALRRTQPPAPKPD